MLMLSIGFRTKQPDHEVKRNRHDVAWYSVHKSHMTMERSKRCKFAHNKSFAVSVNNYTKYTIIDDIKPNQDIIKMELLLTNKCY